MSAHLVALLQEVLGSSFSVENLADLCTTVCRTFRVCACADHLCEHLDQVLGDGSFCLAQSFEFLLRLVCQRPHPFEKHLDNLVACRNHCLKNEARQEGEAFGRRKIQQIRRIQTSCNFCEMDDFCRAEIFDQRLHASQRLEPDETTEPFIQVREGGTFGRVF